jgi:hypothetical protein
MVNLFEIQVPLFVILWDEGDLCDVRPKYERQGVVRARYDFGREIVYQ